MACDYHMLVKETQDFGHAHMLLVVAYLYTSLC